MAPSCLPISLFLGGIVLFFLVLVFPRNLQEGTLQTCVIREQQNPVDGEEGSPALKVVPLGLGVAPTPEIAPFEATVTPLTSVPLSVPVAPLSVPVAPLRETVERIPSRYSLLVRTYYKDAGELMNILLTGLSTFWNHTRFGSLIIVLDAETPQSYELGDILLDAYPGLVSGIHYENLSAPPEIRNKDRSQWSNFYVDLQVPEEVEYIGIVDVDSLLVTFPTWESMFEGDRPIWKSFVGFVQHQVWADMAKQTMVATGLPEFGRSMSFFPVWIKKAHLKSMRDYICKTMGQKDFDDAFRIFSSKPYSQFGIMGNYLWYFRREEYAFQYTRLDEQWDHWAEGQLPTTEFVNARNSYPVPRLFIHWNYHLVGAKRWKMEPREHIHFGYCYFANFSSLVSDCPAEVLTKTSVEMMTHIQEDLWSFDHNHWSWDAERCLESQILHYQTVERDARDGLWNFDLIPGLEEKSKSVAKNVLDRFKV